MVCRVNCGFASGRRLTIGNWRGSTIHRRLRRASCRPLPRPGSRDGLGLAGRDGEDVVVGVNRLTADEPSTIEVLRIDPEIERRQVERVRGVRAARDERAWRAALDAVSAAARSADNLVPAIIGAVEARATVGEISDAMRAVFGEHQDPLAGIEPVDDARADHEVRPVTEPPGDEDQGRSAVPRAEEDEATRVLLDRVNARQHVMLTGCTVDDGRFLGRVCVLSFRTHRDRMEAAIEDVRASLGVA